MCSHLTSFTLDWHQLYKSAKADPFHHPNHSPSRSLCNFCSWFVASADSSTVNSSGWFDNETAVCLSHFLSFFLTALMDLLFFFNDRKLFDFVIFTNKIQNFPLLKSHVTQLLKFHVTKLMPKYIITHNFYNACKLLTVITSMQLLNRPATLPK